MTRPAPGARLADLAVASRDLAATPGRNAKRDRLAALLAGVAPAQVPLAVAYMTGRVPQGRIGIGHAALRKALPARGATAPTLGLDEVDACLQRIAATAGPGSAARRRALLSALLGRATAAEQVFLIALLGGELRQGAVDGVALEAVAVATGVPAAALRRALTLRGDLLEVARLAREGGTPALAAAAPAPLRPLAPMLADTAPSPAAALARLGEALFEYKLDGARVQVHKLGAEVRVFSRRLHDVSAAVPEILDLAAALPARDLILDGEALTLRADGSPHPFQITMRRFGRRQDVDALRRELPLSVFFFDLLFLDGEDLTRTPGARRIARLDALLPPACRLPRRRSRAVHEAEAFLRQALAAGHEGVVAKSPDAVYAAGRRGGDWLKIKPVHTLDLVVLAAEWGHGRRRGWLSNLHLGARAEDGGFVMLGKTFKGLSDELLRWQTARLRELALREDNRTVYVAPVLVVEIACDGVQRSPHYPGGLALRFARVRGYREDKDPGDADTIDRVRALLPVAGKI